MHRWPHVCTVCGGHIFIGLHRGRLHSSVDSNDEDDDVSGARAALAHGGKELVAGRVDECDRLIRARVHGEGGDGLSDAACLGRCKAAAAKGV